MSRERPRIPCAGGIVFDRSRRLLVIRRGRPPAQGLWSVPGGHCLPGEAAERACVREVLEETGLEVRVLRLAGTVVRAAPEGGDFVINDFVCALVAEDQRDATVAADGRDATVADDRSDAGVVGGLRAGDDAMDARWVTRAELADLDLSPGLWDALDQWSVLPD